MIAALFLAAAVSSAMPAVMPSGSFTCQRLMAEKFDTASKDDFLPSVLGTFKLDGAGGYVHPDGTGKVVLDKALLRFTEGTMRGIIASQRTDAQGRVYLLIDKSIIEPPQAMPHYLDAVCYKAANS